MSGMEEKNDKKDQDGAEWKRKKQKENGFCDGKERKEQSVKVY